MPQKQTQASFAQFNLFESGSRLLDFQKLNDIFRVLLHMLDVMCQWCFNVSNNDQMYILTHDPTWLCSRDRHKVWYIVKAAVADHMAYTAQVRELSTQTAGVHLFAKLEPDFHLHHNTIVHVFRAIMRTHLAAQIALYNFCDLNEHSLPLL